MPSTINYSTNLFFLIGLMGSGKTYSGNLISKNKDFVFLDMDDLIEEELGMPVSEIFSQFGETFFRKKESDLVKRIISKQQSAIVATGGGTPCFNHNMELMNKNGITIWLNESVDLIIERIKKSKLQRPLLANLSNDELKPYLDELLLNRNEYYSKSKYQLSSTEINQAKLMKIINHYV